jgi:hypothetical protein
MPLYPAAPTVPYFSAPPTGAVGETLRRVECNSQAVAIGATTGTVYMAAVWLPAGVVLNNVSFITGSTAAGTPTHWWVGIADSGGVQRAASADQLTAAMAANSALTVALASPYTTATAGIYYYLLSVTATTNPTLTGAAAVTNSSKVTPVLAGVSSSAAQSTPGTNGTTTYALPTGDNAIGYFYGS